jgi:hypothetical protein
VAACAGPASFPAVRIRHILAAAVTGRVSERAPRFATGNSRKRLCGSVAGQMCIENEADFSWSKGKLNPQAGCVRSMLTGGEVANSRLVFDAALP